MPMRRLHQGQPPRPRGPRPIRQLPKPSRVVTIGTWRLHTRRWRSNEASRMHISQLPAARQRTPKGRKQTSCKSKADAETKKKRKEARRAAGTRSLIRIGMWRLSIRRFRSDHPAHDARRRGTCNRKRTSSESKAVSETKKQSKKAPPSSAAKAAGVDSVRVRCPHQQRISRQ